MTSETRLTAVTSKGVLTFDGEVVEAFGYGRDRSVRAHVAMLDKIEVGQGGRFTDPSVSFRGPDMPIAVFADFTEEEAASSEVTGLIDAVRAVSPNLKEGG